MGLGTIRVKPIDIPVLNLALMLVATDDTAKHHCLVDMM